MSHDVDKCYYMLSEEKMQAFFEKISKKIFKAVNCTLTGADLPPLSREINTC